MSVDLRSLRTAVIAGGAAGALVVTGVKTTDKLITVVNVAAASANLVDEFEISDADEIDNTGGTDTTLMILLVQWISAHERGGAVV